MVPNPDYSGSPKAGVKLQFKEYTSDTAVYTALRTGALTTDGPNVAVPSTDLARAGKGFEPPSNPLASEGYTLDPAYEYGIGYAYINFNNPTYGPVFKQVYFRQALMMLNNRKSMSSSVGRSYSYPTTAGVPPEPSAGNPFVSSAMQENGGSGPYPYDPSKAEALLAAHGWKVVGGVLTCKGSCGAGIAKGTQAKFSIIYTSGLSTQAAFVQILKSGFSQAGIQLTAVPETFHNYANYNAEQVPSLWLPWNTSIYAVSNDLHNATWSPFTTYFPQFWTCSNATCATR